MHRERCTYALSEGSQAYYLTLRPLNQMKLSPRPSHSQYTKSTTASMIPGSAMRREFGRYSSSGAQKPMRMECFLEKPEWQALNEKIVSDNAKLPDSSLYTDVIERASLLVIKIPGHMKQVRELRYKSPREQAKLRPALLQRVRATRAALRGIYTEFGVAVSMLRSGHSDKKEFIGPLPHLFFDAYSTLFTKGVRSGLRILNYLVILLDPAQRSLMEEEIRQLSDDTPTRSEYGGKSLPTPPGSPEEPKLEVKSLITPENRRPPITPWMDSLVTTMGLEGVEIRLME
ncbi:hypothetical protein EYZ11_004863 [Aspergillus tanneri]|uniref:Uncharacterized protein n=1 Tax=Aspergillus tanneri TaxID=1220188 RepID=A0A4S3JJZ8_9EURO|nr:hypothetical protein EYZ11_004863 [Aspergillus tanneri]